MTTATDDDDWGIDLYTENGDLKKLRNKALASGRLEDITAALDFDAELDQELAKRWGYTPAPSFNCHDLRVAYERLTGQPYTK